jgi:AraC family transcriptional regulator
MVSHAFLQHSVNHRVPWPTEAWSETGPTVPDSPDTCSKDATPTAASAEVIRILADVRHAMDRNPEDARAAALQLVALFTSLAEVRPAIAHGGLAPWQERRVNRYVRGHLEHTMRLEDLAEQVSLSASHFCRAFKESFGSTPHAYIMQLRLTQAQELMLATRDPLSQIAAACGFADQAHLSKLFRSRLGEAPNAWRRRNLVDPNAEASEHPDSAASAGTARLSLVDTSGNKRNDRWAEQGAR